MHLKIINIKNLTSFQSVVFSTLSNANVGYIVGWVLWHINPCWLFNAKPCLFIDIKCIFIYIKCI